MSTKLATVIADFTTQLTTALAIGGTTASLASATDDDGVALPSGIYFFTIDGGNSQKEHIVCSLSGLNLTAIQSVSRQGAETSGAARLHRVGATVSITDFAHLYFINALIGGKALLDSAFPLEYDAAPTLTGANQIMTRSAVLALVNGGPVSFNEMVVSGTAGETFSAGAPIYLKTSDSRWYKALANDTTIIGSGIIFGIALGAGSAGVSITGGVALNGLVSTLSGLTANTIYYISDTGTLATSAGTYSLPIGLALTTTSLLLLASPTIPSVAEKSALGGSQGVLGPSNKFLTQDNLYTAETDQTQATQNSTVEVGEANVTGKKNLIAQSFIPAKTKISGVRLYKSANTGSFTGTVKVALQADSSGSPSGSDLASVTITNAVYLALGIGDFKALFSSEYASMVVGNLYWIVITPSTSDTSNHPNLGVNTAGGYASGSAKYKNTTDGWVAISTIDLYFKTLQGVNSQVVETDSTGNLPAVNGKNLVDIAKHIVGAAFNSAVKTYFNVQLLFMLWAGSVQNDATTTFINWVPSGTNCEVFRGGAFVYFKSTGSVGIALDVFYGGTTTRFINWATTGQTLILDWFAKLPASGTGDINMGFGSDTNTGNFPAETSAYNSSTSSKVMFCQSAAGLLYATICKQGTGVTNTEITDGIDVTKWNNYRIEFTPGTDARFYVNGVLKATLSGANLETGGGTVVDISVGFGRSNTSLFTVAAPNLSVQLI